MSNVSIKKRFEAYFNKSGKASCWIWRGCLDTNGYGKFYVNGKTQRTHRVSFSLYVRRIVPGERIGLKCNNKKCVNPNHLVLYAPTGNIDYAQYSSSINIKALVHD